jgi:hypothetical protein
MHYLGKLQAEHQKWHFEPTRPPTHGTPPIEMTTHGQRCIDLCTLASAVQLSAIVAATEQRGRTVLEHAWRRVNVSVGENLNSSPTTLLFSG